jgi:hypothetical protein
VAEKLVKSPDFKVRLQAALALGRLKEPKTLPALVRCLGHDDHYLVRAFCATALGNLGLPTALPALRAQLKDAHAFVRDRSQKAMDRILVLHPLPAARGQAGGGYQVQFKPKASVFLHVMPVSRKRVPASAKVLGFLQQALRVRLNENPAFEVNRERISAPLPWLQGRQLKAVVVHTTLVRLDRRSLPTERTVTAGLNAVVSRYPNGGVMLMASTEAQTRQPLRGKPASARDQAQSFEYLEREAVEGAAERIAQRIAQSSFH